MSSDFRRHGVHYVRWVDMDSLYIGKRLGGFKVSYVSGRVGLIEGGGLERGVNEVELVWTAHSSLVGHTQGLYWNRGRLVL